MDAAATEARLLKRIRCCLWIVFWGLLISGVTAFPLETELAWLSKVLGAGTWPGEHVPGLAVWLEKVHVGLRETNQRFPFLAYGTDWLAFAHLMLAVLFWGPIKDPVRNHWVVKFGLLACVGIVPLAVICGPVREIPWGWTVIDVSFAVLGGWPLWVAHKNIQRLEKAMADAR